MVAFTPNWYITEDSIIRWVREWTCKVISSDRLDELLNKEERLESIEKLVGKDLPVNRWWYTTNTIWN